MSDDVQFAHEVESLIVGNEPNLIGFFAGGVLPHIAVPDAPINSRYYRSTGDLYVNKNVLGGFGSLAGDWVIDDINSIGSKIITFVPFYKPNGQQDPIVLLDAEILPFINQGGSQDDIDLINGEVPFFSSVLVSDPISLGTTINATQVPFFNQDGSQDNIPVVNP